MRKAVLIIPHWLSVPEAPSFLRSPLPALQHLAEKGLLRKCLAMPQSETPEAAWLGFDPSKLVLKDGPLTVSALGADPPADSVQFHLSLMSFEEGTAGASQTRIPEAELAELLAASKKLNTKTLTIVEGEQTDHGLVWEKGSLDLATHPPKETLGKDPNAFLPEGDGEPILRRFIDDSINLLSELELNRRRVEEGLPLLNLWWPWGQGLRTAVPNLALRRAEVAFLESGSMRLAGLTRLAGYRHGNPSTFRQGAKVNLEQALETIRTRTAAICVVDAFTLFRSHERWEECDWFAHELETRLFGPLADLSVREPFFLSLIACGGHTGLAEPKEASLEGLVLDLDTRLVRSNSVPFDEPSLEEKSLSWTTPWEGVEKALVG